ncbi:MAG: molybdopterin molybdotransferase MoeA [Cycloclasticus sp.]|nr:molybdopterin molybdotransferase MoeA [Cycloclasticus sp.]MBQ0789306.1 molybdopterin molybdotransferase MoeA [Cycloclasticus sp.]
MIDACANKELLTLKQALKLILDVSNTTLGFERVNIKNARNRVLYEPIHSAIDVPSFRNSSMDGYALHHSYTEGDKPSVVGTSWAGRPFLGDIKVNECIRIFTGAFVPDQCDRVIMQENAQQDKGQLKISAPPLPHENIRNIASDTHKNQRLLNQGKRLKTADLGLLASCGIMEAPVFKRLTVGFFSTGDELIPLGTAANIGQIYDSNRYTLHALLEEAGAIAIDMGVIKDEPEAVEKALLSASTSCDVIITSGGVSVGEADFITPTLAKIGRVDAWKVAIKPGKPLVFGKVNNALFFGLPGNPVSVMITFQQIVLPSLQKLMGQHVQQQAMHLHAICEEEIKKQPGRMEFQRGIATNKNGQLTVRTTGDQSSHRLNSMSDANCLIVLQQADGNIAEGQTVNIQLLENTL